MPKNYYSYLKLVIHVDGEASTILDAGHSMVSTICHIHTLKVVKGLRTTASI